MLVGDEIEGFYPVTRAIFSKRERGTGNREFRAAPVFNLHYSMFLVQTSKKRLNKEHRKWNGEDINIE
jgi:hypothetical protein